MSRKENGWDNAVAERFFGTLKREGTQDRHLLLRQEAKAAGTEYLDDHGLRRHELFRRLLQSLIELSPAGSDERTLLESLSNHVQAKGAKPEDRQATLAFGEEEA